MGSAAISSLPQAEIQGLLYPAQANLDIFLRGFSLFQLSSTQPESPLA
jgi:hypothetical protein